MLYSSIMMYSSYHNFNYMKLFEINVAYTLRVVYTLVSMGSGDHLLSGGPHARLPTFNLKKLKKRLFCGLGYCAHL